MTGNITIETRVAGIPCIIELLEWEKYSRATRDYDAEGGVGVWRLLDTRGRPAPWLEAKLTDKDLQFIDRLLFEEMER
jgi:hypothetical protein